RLSGPEIVRARGNRFIANDIGIYTNSQPFLTVVTRMLDFGNAGEDGQNRFHCNSTPKGWPSPGYDVWFDASASSDATLGFIGNFWDHDAPTLGGSGVGNGTDVVTRNGPTIDASKPTLLADDCPLGRIR